VAGVFADQHAGMAALEKLTSMGAQLCLWPASQTTATAALVWSGDLPRLLQQVLFDTADSVVF
jgi:hypothetical protein